MAESPYDQIRELILTSEIAADEQLTEAALATRLGVSRTPVREALKRLEQDGLLERFGRGLRIKERSPEEVLDIYAVRIPLEEAAARGAAANRTELDVSRLEAIHEQMLKLLETDLRGHIIWNNRFHEMLWKASHNPTLEDVMVRLLSHLIRYPQSTLSSPGRWDRVLAEHRELLDAIEPRDADRAGQIAAEHMTEARDTRLRMYADEQMDLTGRISLPR